MTAAGAAGAAASGGPAGAPAEAVPSAPRAEGSVLLRVVVLGVLVVNAVLLALTEVAWLSLRVGEFPLPLSALLAAVTVPWLVRAAERVRPGTRMGLVPLVVWFAVVIGFGLWSPAGGWSAPAMVPDWRALLLLAAGLLPGALALPGPARVDPDRAAQR